MPGPGTTKVGKVGNPAADHGEQPVATTEMARLGPRRGKVVLAQLLDSRGDGRDIKSRSRRLPRALAPARFFGAVPAPDAHAQAGDERRQDTQPEKKVY